MADCNFSIPFEGPASAIVAKIQAEIQKQGGTFDGNDSSGSFSVSVLGSTISGTYTISGQNINVIINDKPFFIGCSQIENFLKGHIG